MKDEPRSQTLSEEIESLYQRVKSMKDKMDKSDSTRLIAIVATHLETAKLFAREAGQ